MGYELEIIKKQLNEIKNLNNLLKKALEKEGKGNLYLILETLTSLFSQTSNLKEEHSFILNNQNKIIEIVLENRKFLETIAKKIGEIEKSTEELKKEFEIVKSERGKKKGLFG